jgi:hypothetical protein
MGGYLDGPGGIKVKIERQEFPYDIGIWRNLKQGMGTGNVDRPSRLAFGAKLTCIVGSGLVLAICSNAFHRERSEL